LALTGQHTFIGVLRPLANPFTLYLRIFRDEGGVLMAAFRNPEQHSHGPANQYRVAQDGDAVHFTAGSDPAAPEYRLEAKYLSAIQRVRIDWPDAGGEIELVRRTPQEAAKFFPRPLGSGPYEYREPPVGVDGWETARAGDLGIDEAAIARMVQSIIDGDPAARRPSLIHSILVAYRGKLVLDEYFFGFERDQPHDLRSAGKTFASILLGAAIKDGAKIRPDTKIYSLMSASGPFANPDPRKAEITLSHLMTHSAGLACNDNDGASPGNEDTMQAQSGQPDWWKYTLDLPMTNDPGKRYAYCSANINLAGGALTTATGTWLPELFRQKVADPLQFIDWHWNLMPNDEGYLGGGAFLRPRDLLKVGQAFLDDGVWKGRRIVSAAWVKESTAPRMKITPATTGLSAEEFQEAYSEGEDALAWHLNGLRVGERRYAAYAATGNGGQVLIVVPELELAAVFTGGNYMQGGIWGRWADQLIGGYIVPGIRKGDGT
jgi:CubicO group peptidase (beta-lactamase class C family)